MVVRRRAPSGYLDDGIHRQLPPAEIEVAVLTDGRNDHGAYNADVEDKVVDMSTDEESDAEDDDDGGESDDDDELQMGDEGGAEEYWNGRLDVLIDMTTTDDSRTQSLKISWSTTLNTLSRVQRIFKYPAANCQRLFTWRVSAIPPVVPAVLHATPRMNVMFQFKAVG